MSNENVLNEIDDLLNEIDSLELEQAESEEVAEMAAMEGDSIPDDVLQQAVIAAEIEELDEEIALKEPKTTLVTPSEDEQKELMSDGKKGKRSSSGRSRTTVNGLSRREAILSLMGGEEEAIENFVLTESDKSITDPTDKELRLQTKLNEFDGLAKKVGEKLVNAFAFYSGKSSLSNYTSIAIKALKDSGSLTSQEMIDCYASNEEKCLAMSTARAQANQMFHLLPALEVAKRVGSRLELNEDSAFLSYFETANDQA